MPPHRFSLPLPLLLALAAACCFTLLASFGPKAEANTANGLASAVWGQTSLSATTSCGQASATTMCTPTQAVVDSQGNLWVADTGDSRVLLFRYDRALGRPAPRASKVFGQYGSLRSTGCNAGPPAGTSYPQPAPASAYTLCYPQGVAVNRAGTLFVSDSGNSRVLIYPHAASTSLQQGAELVLGQPSLSSASANTVVAGSSGPFTCPGVAGSIVRKSASGNGLAHFKVKLDGTFRVGYGTKIKVSVKDAGKGTIVPNASVSLSATQVGVSAAKQKETNSSGYALWKKVLPRRAGDIVIKVIRQSFADETIQIHVEGPSSQCALANPEQLALDSSGDLLVADTGNNRVLLWKSSTLDSFKAPCSVSCFIPASMIWGQAGDFTTTLGDAWPPYGYSGPCPRTPSVASACTLNKPGAVAASPSGDLFISDTGDNRVLSFPKGLDSLPEQATYVYGQRGNFGTTALNEKGVGPSSLAAPFGLMVGTSSRLWVADGNNRVLEYPPARGKGSTSAVLVLGQPNLTSSSCNTTPDPKTSLCSPQSVADDSAGNLYVSDSNNNRILEYFPPKF